MTKTVMGFPSTSQDHYQLNTINIFKGAEKAFGGQEIVCRTSSGMMRYTYSDAYKRIKKLGSALKKLEIQVGDRVGVLDWNTHRHFEMYYGIPGIGAVILLLNLRLSPPDLGYVINHSETSYIAVDESLIPIAESVQSFCDTVKGYIIITDKPISEIKTTLSPIYSYEELLSDADEIDEWPVMDEKSAYGACYTTGTTGKPKGVYYSHRNVYLHAMALASFIGMTSKDCFYQLVPMFHALGWGAPHSAIMVGAKFLLPGMYNIANLGDLAEPLINENVTCSAGAPALFMPMLEYIKTMDTKPDLTGAKFLCGASEPSFTMMKEFYDLTGAEIIHAYGATETSPLAAFNAPRPWVDKNISEEERWENKKKQGFPAPGLDIKIVDPFGKELPSDGESAGEIYIRGPWITGSYYNNEKSGDSFSEDGYWKTGDAGTIDKNGLIKITDRVKDTIKSGGEWISSIDMENEILSHKAVLEAAVVGVTHPKWEERPVSIVVLREEFKGKISEDEIRKHLEKKFAKWQLPEKVIFTDLIPKTSVGKYDKKVMRETYQDIYIIKN